jgi:glycosyltransferase involved in cell wall biosynthesis
VVTSEAKDEILTRVAITPNNIIEVPNTVRKSFYTNPKPVPEILNQYSNTFVLLYIGDTGIRRGLKTAIKSIALLKNKIDTLKLVIVGSNSSDPTLKKLVKDLQIESYVDFLGWKDQSLFQSYILASDICISPLHRNLHHDTTYANKIFQYMSLAKPLVVSDAIAQQKLIDKVNAGLVHTERNVEDFTYKILALYKSKSLRIELGANGKDFVQNEFSWEETSKKLINLYDNLEN